MSQENIEIVRAAYDEARAEVTELIAADDKVVVSATARGRGKLSGAEAMWHRWQLWTLRDGKLVRGQGFTSREEALRAAGLETSAAPDPPRGG